MSGGKPYTVTISHFRTSASISDLYANGRMPVAIIAQIVVLDKDSKRFPTSESWLKQNLRLVDYHEKSREIPSVDPTTIPSGWATSWSDAGWAHAGSPLPSTPQQTDAGTLDDSIMFYLKTKTAESRSFALRVKDPAGTDHYSSAGTGDKEVIVKAIPAHRYNTLDLHIEEVFIKEAPWPMGKTWYQTNTYISSKKAGHPFVKLEPFNYGWRREGQPGMDYCWTFRDGGEWSITTRHWYTWPMNVKRRQVGPFKHIPPMEIDVNQRSNAACVTLWETEPQWVMKHLPGWWYGNHWVRIFDKYGNQGSFALKTKDDLMKLVVEDQASLAETDNDEEITVPKSEPSLAPLKPQ